MKMKIVTKNWKSKASCFKKVTPTAGLFRNKQTKKILFETKNKSWSEPELLNNMNFVSGFRLNGEGKYVKYTKVDVSRRERAKELIWKKDWNKLFFKLTDGAGESFTLVEREFIGALAEVVDLKAKYGSQRVSALIASVMCSHSDAVDVLLNRKVNIEVKDAFGDTALKWAAKCCRESTGIMEMLLKFNANVHETCQYGWTALHTATTYGNLHGMEMLLESGANIDAISNDLETPLMRAAQTCKPRGDKPKRCVEFLLKKGAKTSLKNEHGQTALDFARGFNCALVQKSKVI